MPNGGYDQLSFLGASRTKRWFSMPSMRVRAMTPKLKHYVGRQNPKLSPHLTASLKTMWKGSGWTGKT